MKKINTILIILGWYFLCQCQMKPSLKGDNLLVLRGGVLIDGQGSKPTTGNDIIIENKTIKSISPIGKYNYPDNTTILNLKGKYIIPGLIEMHAHFPGDSSIQAAILRIYLSFGITTILNPMADYDSGLGLKKKIQMKRIIGPKLFTAGKGINGPSFLDKFGLWVPVNNEEEVRAEVRNQAKQGVDFIKVYAHLPPELLKIVIDESHRQGLKVIGHLGKTSWIDAAESGIDVIVHSALSGPTWELIPDGKQKKFASNYLPSIHWPNDYDPTLFSEWVDLVNYEGDKTQKLISTLLKNNVTVDPNLVVYESIVWGNKKETKAQLGTEYAPEEIKAQWSSDKNPSVAFWGEDDYLAVQKAWPKFLDFVRILHKKGIILTAGSDLSNAWIAPGASYHRELELLVKSGISSSDVLQIATKNAAHVLGVLDKIGTIEIGKVADIVILDGDPIKDITNTKKVHLVIIEGEKFTKEDLNNYRKTKGGDM